MSYTSQNILPKESVLSRLREVISLLGYQKVIDGLKIPHRTDSMMWFESHDYKSWVGVELDVYREKGQIKVDTRTRAGRSYWDLVHQNKTIKIIKDLFGGYFITDEGKNRYLMPNGKPPSPISSGCYLAKWHFDNALIKPRLYLDQRKLDGQISRDGLTGLEYIDEINPRIFSNNLILPYLVAIWEEYFKFTFITLLKYSENRELAFKKAKLSQDQLESVATGIQDIEGALAENLSFQRPSKVGDNFKLIDPRLDLIASLRKPYHGRKKSLCESIESVVELRNAFVHTGQMNVTVLDSEIKKIIKDYEVAINRVYNCISAHYKFKY